MKYLSLFALTALGVSPAFPQDGKTGKELKHGVLQETITDYVIPVIADSEWPPETGMYKPGQGSELAQALCMNCHSVEYVSTQPPMPRKFWEATVKKMKDKYAAPLPDDMTAIVDYLTAAYGAKPAQP